MSTAEIYIEPDEARELAETTLATELLTTVGEDGRDIGIAPYISFYVYHDEAGALLVADKMIEIFEIFESSIIDEPFALVSLDDDVGWLSSGDPRLTNSDLKEVARKGLDELEPFLFGATDMESLGQTARWSFMATVNHGLGDRYTRLKLTFRLKWYRQNKARWHAFVEDCVKRLQPDQCYSGFEVGNGDFNIIGSYEADVLERVLADYFYGMDIDHPSPMSFHHFRDINDYGTRSPNVLGAGIRTPTWSFMLSPYWQGRLGKTEAQIRAELDDPRIVVNTIDYPTGPLNPEGRPGLWIRLGELDLHPVDKGVPELLFKANRLIRPIRCDYLKLLTLDPWDDDPNPRFDFETSLRWMRRFDSNSDWPTGKRKGLAPAPAQGLRGMPSERVPQSGMWWTPAIKGAEGQRRFEAGQSFPEVKETEWGAVVWYSDA